MFRANAADASPLGDFPSSSLSSLSSSSSSSSSAGTSLHPPLELLARRNAGANPSSLTLPSLTAAGAAPPVAPMPSFDRRNVCLRLLFRAVDPLLSSSSSPSRNCCPVLLLVKMLEDPRNDVIIPPLNVEKSSRDARSDPSRDGTGVLKEERPHPPPSDLVAFFLDVADDWNVKRVGEIFLAAAATDEEPVVVVELCRSAQGGAPRGPRASRDPASSSPRGSSRHFALPAHVEASVVFVVGGGGDESLALYSRDASGFPWSVGFGGNSAAAHLLGRQQFSSLFVEDDPPVF